MLAEQRGESRDHIDGLLHEQQTLFIRGDMQVVVQVCPLAPPRLARSGSPTQGRARKPLTDRTAGDAAARHVPTVGTHTPCTSDQRHNYGCRYYARHG